jgi:hypothetical protein
LSKKLLNLKIIIMKKLLLFKKMIIVVLLVGLSSAGWAQALLYEGFDYATPAFIGGNGDAGTTSNNWTTHSVVAGHTTTVDIQDGSLSYSGLVASTGNKVYLFGNANATDRDVNRAFTSTAKILYYSALVNIIDNSQILAAGDYFMSFGGTTGSAISLLGGRLGAKLAASSTNFRFMVLNNSGGTPVYTDNGADLNFGTTYLIVIKYDISVSTPVATMWINPTSLGGAEPAGGISNSTGVPANPFTTLASICLRENGATPKANIDEIRVGLTFADVTPLAPVGLTNRDQAQRQTTIYPNPAKSFFNVKAPAGDYVVSINNTVGSLVKSVDLNSTGKVEMSDLRPGIYYVTVKNVNTNTKEVHKLIVR